jgi:D-alanine-D-alanine ligase
MRIGLTYDLRSWYLERGYTMDETAEFDKEETISSIEKVLNFLGYDTERIGNIFELVDKLSAGKKWDLVFNIAEGLYGDGRESVVPALLDQYRIPYVFSGPVIMGLSLNKFYARLLIQSAGVPVCQGVLVSSPDDIINARALAYPLFAKPVAEGTGKGITEKSKVHNEDELTEICIHLLSSYNQPVLVEEYLPGREFTVGITGEGNESEIVGGMEVICKDNLPYSRDVKENYEEIVKYRLIDDEIKEECYNVALGAWKALGGVDAGRIDVRADRNGRICFIEANPLAGLNPIHSDLPMLARMNGLKYEDLMSKILKSAIKRNVISNS